MISTPLFSESWAALLLTDLMGSTSLWQADAPAMERALSAHDHALQNLVRRAGGSVFKMTGDGMMAAFPDVAGALQCAMKARYELHFINHRHPTCKLADRLRLLVHAGRVYQSAGDRRGPEVCYASRLVATAPTQTILVTEPALMALDRAAFPSLQFSAHHTAALKDFGTGRPVYRLG